MAKEALKSAEEAVETTAEKKGWKIPGVKATTEWMKSLKPKAEPMLTAPIPEMGELAAKSDDVLRILKYEMKPGEVADIISKLYETLTSKKFHVNPSDAAGIMMLMGKLYEERPDAIKYLKLSQDPAAEGVKQLITDGKLIPGKLEAADALNIFTILFNEKISAGEEIDAAVKVVEKRFKIQLSVSERAAFFKELYRRNMITSEQIIKQKAFQQGKIMAILGLDLEATSPLDRVFQKKLAEAGDSPEKYIYASLVEETTIKEVEKIDPDLAKILREARNKGSDEEGWKYLKKVFKSMGEDVSELDAMMKQLQDELKAYKIFSEVITPTTVEAAVLGEKEAKYYTSAVKEGFDWAKAGGKGIKVAKGIGAPFLWPAYKAAKIPKTKGFTKGKVAKAGWWVFQLAWITALGVGAYYGVYKPLKVKKAKEETKEKIRLQLEKRGTKSVSDETLEFLATEGAQIWAFIKSKEITMKEMEKYPDPKTLEVALKTALKDPTKGPSIFNYQKIDAFVAYIKQLKKEGGYDTAFMSENYEKFIKEGFFIPEGFTYIFSFCKDFGFSEKVGISFLKARDHFLWLYSALYNGVIPRSSIPVNPKGINWVVELEDKFSKKYDGEQILALGSLLDLLDQYSALGLVEQVFFDKSLDNRAVLNALPIAKDEIVYGSITKLISKIPVPAFEGDLSFAIENGEFVIQDARDPSKDLPYFIAPKTIAALDHRFLYDVKAVKFILEYSPGNKGLLGWLEKNAKSVKAYELVKHLMKIENLVKSQGIADLTKDKGWLDTYIKTDEGKKYIALRSKSITPKDFFPKAVPGEAEKAEVIPVPKKKKKKVAEVKPKKEGTKAKKKVEPVAKPKEKKPKTKETEPGGF